MQSTATVLISLLALSLPKARNNNGKDNIRFLGPKIWNEIEDSFKSQK